MMQKTTYTIGKGQQSPTTEISALPTALSGIQCPKCKSTKHIKNGKENSSQKYRCKNCGKHYRSTTGSNIHRMHKKQLIETYIQCIYDGLPLRKAAIKTGISLKTSFKWRHKFLAALTLNKESTLGKHTRKAHHHSKPSAPLLRKRQQNTQQKTANHRNNQHNPN